MAFADPTVITINGNDVSLPRISTGDRTSTYRAATGTDGGFLELVVSSQSSKRNRHVIRVNSAQVTEDPISEANLLSTASVTLTIDRPLVGLDTANVKDFVLALCSYLSGSSGANIEKLLSFQS